MNKLKKAFRYAVISSLVVVSGGVLMASTNPDFAFGKNIQILFNMYRELYVFYVDPIDSDKMLTNAAKGMVEDLDPYTVLIPESEMSTFQIQTTGKYGGIGAMIRQVGDYVAIAQPYKGFPADKAGLVIGDKIIEIDGVDLKGSQTAKVSDMLKGEPGTKFKLTVEKLITGERETLTLTRQRIAVSGIPYYGMVSDSVGIIVHNDFTEGCAVDLRNAFMELKKEGMTSLIYDLRSNGGGILQEAVDIISMFVPKGTEIVSMKGRQESPKPFTTNTEPLDLNIPIVVLVGGGSASAAEIMAGAFQDLDRGVVMGQRSFGKGLVQATRPLGFNAYLKITTAKYYIPSGRCIQAIDYTQHNEDGSVNHIPDSLITQYSTKGGRKVYDGAGIMPDTVLTISYVNRFAVVLYAKGYVEDFANKYYIEHREPVDVDGFKINDREYADFVKFLDGKDIDYESQTKKNIEELRRMAEREGYLKSIAPELEAMEQKIKADRVRDFELFREDIVDLLEREIVLRYHYGQGAERHSIGKDKEVHTAVSLLGKRDVYRYILSQQDTRRK